MIKNLLSILFTFCFIITFSQTYEFDYLLRHEVINHKSGFEDVSNILVNTKDLSYTAQFIQQKQGYLLRITDTRRMQDHEFIIDNNADSTVGTNYKYSRSDNAFYNTDDEQDMKAYVYTTTFVEDISDGKRMILKTYKTKSKKRAEREMTAEYIDTIADFRPFTYSYLFSTTFYPSFVTLPNKENTMIKYATWKTPTSVGEYNLEIQKLPLKIVLDPSKVHIPPGKPQSRKEIRAYSEALLRSIMQTSTGN